MNAVPVLVARLRGSDLKSGCDSMQQLLMLSTQSDSVYTFLNEFEQLTEHANAYMRTRGILLIFSNVRWDQTHRIVPWLPRLLTHITDSKPIVSRQVIHALPQLVRDCPDFRDTVLQALAAADCSFYADSMRPLVEKDIREARNQIMIIHSPRGHSANE